MRTTLACVLLVTLLAPACGGPDQMKKSNRRIRQKYPDASQVSVDELATWLSGENAPLLLDVRAQEEFAVSHLRSARRAELLDELLVALEGVPKDTRIVLYCSIGERSSRRTCELGEMGFTNLYNLEGSIFDWANQGFPVYRDGVEVREVHPYSWSWGRLLNKELHAKKPRE
jgi:rhodanese-related sulfurtransferase